MMQITPPTIGLLSKLATIAQIVDEASDAKPINMEAATSLLADRDVSKWLDAMYEQGLIADRPALSELAQMDGETM